MLKISEILSFLEKDGIPFTFTGNAEDAVEGFSSLSHYKPGSFTWVKKQENIPPDFDLSALALAFVSEGVTGNFRNVIETPQSKHAFFSTMEHFYGQTEERPTIGQFTYISPKVKLGKDVCIGYNCALDGNITIGEGCVIGDNVSMRGPITVGARSELRAGVRIGYDDSIAYSEAPDGSRMHIRHFGGVSIGENVLIGENSCICRGTIDDTVIGDRVLLDAMTHISHNCIIGDDAVLIAGCRLFGSVTVGNGAQIVSAVVRNQCSVGEGALVGMGAIVTKSIPAYETVAGNPARPFQKERKG